jgi:hypothetical protein
MKAILITSSHTTRRWSSVTVLTIPPDEVDEVKGMLFKDLEAAGYRPDSKGL